MLALQIPTTFHYSLYWSGHSSSGYYNGQVNQSYLSIWEAAPFSITATRVQESINNIPTLRNPPGNPGRFDGRLRGVSIYFRYNDMKNGNGKSKILERGVLASQIVRGKSGHLLKSHIPIFSIKAGSFWETEYSQYENTSCVGNSKHAPGCFNPADQPDNSSLTLSFPVGLASRPNGQYSDGIFSVLVNRFQGDWNDYVNYTESNQKFIVLLLRMFYY